MPHTVDFFKDEVRNGFYIPTAIKQAWAASLDVLSEIDRICKKHGIKYFADWGTFLGAVRHGGFVPWDDDLDICMLRDDYMKFRHVAVTELPKSYVIHDYESHEDHWLFLSRIVNNSKMCFDTSYLDSHDNFPWLAGVDIFVKDYLYADDEKEIRRDKDIMNIIAVADGIANGEMSRQNASAHVSEIKRRYNVSLLGLYRERDVAVALYKLAEQQMAKVKPEETDRVGQVFPWILKNGPASGEEKEWYQDIIRLPFEDTTIPVPAAYNKVLSRRYGNYNEIRKVWDGHDYPYFEGQKAEMERLSGEKFFGFSFDPVMLDRPSADISSSLKKICENCLAELSAMIHDAESILHGGTLEEFAQTISDTQQLAADLGTLIEQTKGEERDCTKNTVAALQLFCDALWEEYQEVEAGEEKEELPESTSALEKVREAIRINIYERREVLFLPIGVNEWKYLERFYDEISEPDTDVFVVPLPLMKKTFFGNITMTDDEIEEELRLSDYPKELPLMHWTAYDISVHCPDAVYIQNPYDGANPCLTVPPDFYAENLRRFSERIVYVPISKTSDFGSEDVNDQYNLKHYVTAPGVIYADEIILWSENIREQYADALSAFSGEDTRAVWEDRIKVIEDKDLSANDGFEKKVIYCIGANELKENADSFADAVRNRMQTLMDVGCEIQLSVAFYPPDRASWKAVDDTLSDEVFSTVDKGLSVKGCEVIQLIPADADMVASSYDAYYGSPSPLVPAFIVQGKPVMLANYGVRV